ncbi:mitochondrial carrier [Cutaneotrichosporon oleaginosum]|uniref:Mitochondrial carrier n=1 Tax=Cutaneotrichosporon oleaginosum TaxID=879819 RepID=A0A0J1BAR3_9TREE|nr:mitochondrial carrier [Cutaneotrichosporon oleaginosum]KLT44999.1 mitochondrial carrier [Cutaneotrichosporon oleaginosum]TXT09687.1 hypothetical protein COLE_03621 [Cutaneotrichosporon oleaginosum]
MEDLDFWPEPEPGPSRSALSDSTLAPKAIAAMTGALSTSLLMTPFDVLKTRLQTVQPHIPLPIECCQTPLLTPSADVTCATSTLPRAPPRPQPQAVAYALAAPEGCYHPSKWAGIWGEAVSFEEAMTRGFLRGYADERPRGFWSELAAVRRDAGVRGLWKGVGTTLTMAVPSSAIYMLGYEYLLARLGPVFAGSGAGADAILTPAPLIAGSLARTLSASIISPLEMFRTRLQALPTDGRPSPTYASTGRDMLALVRAKGPAILWRGLGPTLWRDVPFSGLYWAGFEIIKAQLAAGGAPLSPIATSFVAGATSGTLAALVTQPFDVLKTRRQVFTPSPGCSPEALRHRASTFPLALHVVRTEGWGALFAGVGPRCGKIAPACGLMIACYEGVGRYLEGKKVGIA